MIKQVYKPSRRRNGKRVLGRMYRGRYRLDPREKVSDVALRTDDKQVAEQRLARIVREEQHEREGLIPPKHQRDAAQRCLTEHLEAFIADRRALGRDEKYVCELKRRVERLIEECSWKLPRDVTADSFRVWRARQSHSPKTLNDYLSAIGALMNWLEAHLGSNPLRRVQRVQSAVEPKRKRRAFTVNELRRLISASSERGPVYLVAASTGIRRGELRSLEWRDVVLDMPQPFIAVRSSVAKNHKHVMQPLPAYVADALQKRRPSGYAPKDLVFPVGIPSIEVFRKDLKAAGIEYVDAEGRYADFHALRKTFGTLLTLGTGSQRTVMELMRHSDMKLTTKVYTDAAVLPVAETVANLPNFISAEKDSQIDSHKSVCDSPAGSVVVPVEPGKPIFLTTGNEVVSPLRGASAPKSPGLEEAGPARIRTWDQGIMSPLL
jgi:integrase